MLYAGRVVAVQRGLAATGRIGMAKRRILPAIMSGGAGTRLWPLSTPECPKQFHKILSDRSMIMETAARFLGAAGSAEFLPPLFVAGEAHRDVLRSELEAAGIEPSLVALEPVGRNTAAVAACVAVIAAERFPGAEVLLLPADHVIGDIAAFRDAIQRAGDAVATSIVTFGMSPTGPETGYGYIEQGAAIDDGVFRIASFKEKPDRRTAQEYLDAGGYSWNSGIFYFRPEILIEEFEAYAPETLMLARQAIERGAAVGRELTFDTEAFAAIDPTPLDIAIMEKTKKGAVAPCSIGWADVGSWAELWRLSQKDEHGNATEGDVLMDGVLNSMVRAEDGVQVSVCGISDVIVVATREHVLVLPRSEAQRVKDLIPED